MSELSDLLNEARGDQSVRAVGRAVASHGVGESTIIPYFNGKHGKPSVQVLEALTKVLPVSIEELYAAAGRPAGESSPYEPPIEANLLNRRQRLALDELIRSFVATKETAHEDQGTQNSPSNSPADGETRASGTPMKLAAVPDHDETGQEPGEPLPYDPEQLHAARDLPGMSDGERRRLPGKDAGEENQDPGDDWDGV